MRPPVLLVVLAVACDPSASAPLGDATTSPVVGPPPDQQASETPQPTSPPTLRTAPALVDAPAPPTIDLWWPGDDVNPRLEDHALALFVEDEWNRALACPNARVTPAPLGAHRCRFDDTSTLEIGGKRLWIAASEHGHEHEGMQFRTLDAVLLAPYSDGVLPLYTFTVLDLDVEDCGSSLTMRRLQAIDLDGDGRGELCVESISEEGVGLFQVMDLEDEGKPWLPLRRARVRAAYRLDADRLTLARRPDLDHGCPPQGYRLPARFLSGGFEAFRGRVALQGEPPLGRCPTQGATTCLPERCARRR